jgi:nucleoside-diphosphate-sugar epimerase
MKVLVTGADGFIGSHLTEALVRAGHDVRAFVQYNAFNHRGWLDHVTPEVADEFDVVAGDIRDPHGTAEAVVGLDAICHLAALLAIPFSYQAPHTYIETNVTGTLNLLQSARAAGITRFVHTSTSEVIWTLT